MVLVVELKVREGYVRRRRLLRLQRVVARLTRRSGRSPVGGSFVSELCFIIVRTVR